MGTSLVEREVDGKIKAGSNPTHEYMVQPGTIWELKKAARRALTPMDFYFITLDIIEHAKDKNNPFKERLEAATWLRDTCIGKPKQEIEMDLRETSAADAITIEVLKAAGIPIPE